MSYIAHSVLHARASGTTADSKESDKFRDLIGPMDPKLDREMREKLVTARVGLLLKASFFGNLATRLKLVNADEWCATAATDGRHFYYNSRFINMLRPKEVEFLFGHEVLHCVYDHFGRRGERDPQIWNVANDFCVNADLKEHRVGEFITSVPCLYDPKYKGLSSEEIYEDLMKNVKQKTAYEMLWRDWSSDVCSSDLTHAVELCDQTEARHRSGNPLLRAPHQHQLENTSSHQRLLQVSFRLVDLSRLPMPSRFRYQHRRPNSSRFDRQLHRLPQPRRPQSSCLLETGESKSRDQPHVQQQLPAMYLGASQTCRKILLRLC